MSVRALPIRQFWQFIAMAGRADPRQLSGTEQTLSDVLGDGEF